MFRRSLFFMVSNNSNRMVISTSTISKPYSKIIILEGNISAGKTFLSSKLGDILGYKVFFEPTATNPFLESFYKEPKKYALIMQLWLLNQRYNTYLNALQYSIENDKGVILDRSVYSDWVFAENCRLEGLISEEGFREYSNKRNDFLSNIPIPNTTLYLDVNPSECLVRIQNRKRDCEQSIPLSYLEGLDSCYKSFLNEMKLKGSNVIIRDWNNFGDPLSIVKEVNNFNNNNNNNKNSVNNSNSNNNNNNNNHNNSSNHVDKFSNNISNSNILYLDLIKQLINETENERINLSEQHYFLKELGNNNNNIKQHQKE